MNVTPETLSNYTADLIGYSNGNLNSESSLKLNMAIQFTQLVRILYQEPNPLYSTVLLQITEQSFAELQTLIKGALGL